jgi:hypothetical protein
MALAFFLQQRILSGKMQIWPPKNNAQILISVEGIYYLGKYEQGKKVFFANDGKATRVFYLKDHNIYWANIVEPAVQRVLQMLIKLNQ